MPVASRIAVARLRVGSGALASTLFLAIAACGGDDSKPATPVGGSGHFVPAREGEPFRHLVVEGTPYEMGRHQGRLVNAAVRARVELRGLPNSEAASLFLPEIRRLLPTAIAEELRGIADGAAVSADTLLLREASREILRWRTDAFRSPALHSSYASAPGAEASVAAAIDDVVGDGRRFMTPFDEPWWLGGPGARMLTPETAADPDLRPLILERRPTGGVATMVLAPPGSLGGLAGISSRGVVIASCEDDSLPSERRSLRGMPFAVGVRFALETATDAQTAFDALPRLVGNRVLIADAANQRLDALVGLSVVGLVRSEPNAWVLRPAGEDVARETNEKAQNDKLASYPARPGANDAIDLAAAGRDPSSQFPVLLLTPKGIDVRDANGKTWTYAWSR